MDLLSSKFQKIEAEEETPGEDPFLLNASYDDQNLGLPTVILLVSENVKLIRNNSIPMLQVQIEIIQDAMNYDNDMC